MRGTVIAPKLRLLLAIWMLLLQLACTTRAPFITPADVRQPMTLEEKEALYAKVQKSAGDNDKQVRLTEDEQNLMRILSRDIVAMQAERIKALTSATSKPLALVPLPQLIEAAKVNRRLQLLAREQAQEFSQQIVEKKKQTEAHLAQIVASPIVELDEESAKQLLLARSLSHRSSAYHTPLINAISELQLNYLLNAQQAYESHDFESAIFYVDKALLLGEQQDAKTLRLQIKAKQSDREIKHLLQEQGDDVALDYLVQLAKDEQFTLLSPFLGEGLDALVGALKSKAEAAMAENDYYHSHLFFGQLQTLAKLAPSTDNQLEPQQSYFLERLFDAARRAAQKNRAGMELGLLLSIAALDPSYPELNEQLSFSKKRVLSQASDRVAVLPFKTIDAHESVGLSFATLLVAELNKSFEQRALEVMLVANPADVEQSQYRIRYLTLGKIQSAQLRFSRLALEGQAPEPTRLVQATSEIVVAFELHDRHQQSILLSNTLTAKSQGQQASSAEPDTQDFEKLLAELAIESAKQIAAKLDSPYQRYQNLAKTRLTEDKVLDAIEALAPLMLMAELHQNQEEGEQSRLLLIEKSLHQAALLGLK